jgi:hypothetical protein
MLERLIARLYRKFRDGRRERRASRLEAEARLEETVADTYRLSWVLSRGLEASSSLQLMSERGWQRHSANAQELRRRARDIRAGRR